jgi:thiosulfate dehydrogenase [quinone] large subunit
MTASTAPVAATVGAPSTTTNWPYTLLGVVRILLGLTFLWAFFDKLLGLGFSTPSERAWINGGSPTAGFLGGSIEAGNPFAGFWEFWLSLNPFTNILFMAGLLGIGLALTFGIGTRIAGVSGAALYVLMYLAAFPLTTNPIIDDHVIMAVLLLALAGLAAGDHVGLGRAWKTLVGKHTWLI